MLFNRILKGIITGSKSVNLYGHTLQSVAVSELGKTLYNAELRDKFGVKIFNSEKDICAKLV